MAAIDEALKGNGLALSTFVVFSRAGHAIHEKEMETIKQSGLTAMQFGVLEALYNKGPLKICEVMEKLLTTSGNITVVVKNLERDGLIRKEQDPKDGRACKLAITEEGKNDGTGSPRSLRQHRSHLRRALRRRDANAEGNSEEIQGADIWNERLLSR